MAKKLKFGEKLSFFALFNVLYHPLDPTGRKKHVQMVVQVVFKRKNTGCTTKYAPGGRYEKIMEK